MFGATRGIFNYKLPSVSRTNVVYSYLHKKYVRKVVIPVVRIQLI